MKTYDNRLARRLQRLASKHFDAKDIEASKILYRAGTLVCTHPGPQTTDPGLFQNCRVCYKPWNEIEAEEGMS